MASSDMAVSISRVHRGRVFGEPHAYLLPSRKTPALLQYNVDTRSIGVLASVGTIQSAKKDWPIMQQPISERRESCGYAQYS